MKFGDPGLDRMLREHWVPAGTAARSVELPNVRGHTDSACTVRNLKRRAIC